MNGTQTLIAILTIAAIAGGGWCLQMWLAAQSHDRQIALEVRKHEQEFERYRMIVDLANQKIQLAGQKILSNSNALDVNSDGYEF